MARVPIANLKGPKGETGPRGLPGVNAVENDEAVATYVREEDTATHSAVLEVAAAKDVQDIVERGRLSPDQLTATIDEAVASNTDYAKLVSGLRQATNNAAKYILNTYWPTAYPGAGAITDWGGTTEHFVRPPANSVYAVATLIGQGQYDPEITGVSEASAKAATLRVLNGLAATHLANGGTWGGRATFNPLNYDYWQGYWAYMMGLAGFALWDNLTSAQRDAIKAVIVWEAGRVVHWPIWPTWKTRAGVENFAGDSKSEETAWSAGVLVLALIMDPTSALTRDYRLTLARMAVYQDARPADLTDSAPVNGIVPATMLTGTNITDDGLIVNHQRVHADYMVSAGASIYLALAAAADAGLAIPAVVGRNAGLIYRALGSVIFTPGVAPAAYPAGGPAANPGGSLYPWPAKGTLYAPQGNDWGNRRVVPALLFDVLAHRHGWDRGVHPDGAWWALTHLREALAMQERFSTGQTYPTGDWTEDSYGQAENQPYSREAYVAVCLAGALHAMLSGQPARTWADLTTPADTGTWTQAVAATTPAIWWRLGEASGNATDASGNGRVGELATFGTAGTFNVSSLVPSDASNGAHQFNGGSRFRHEDLVFLGTGQRSYGVAFKKASAPVSEQWFLAQANVNGAATVRLFGLRFATDGKLIAQLWRADGSSGSATSAVSVCDNVTHLVVVSITNGGAVIYLDGKPLMQISRADPNFASTDKFTVGSATDAGAPATVTLDEALCWTRALAEHEVADLYRAFVSG